MHVAAQSEVPKGLRRFFVLVECVQQKKLRNRVPADFEFEVFAPSRMRASALACTEVRRRGFLPHDPEPNDWAYFPDHLDGRIIDTEPMIIRRRELHRGRPDPY